ncbi:hypothetical protein B0H12DRAFT_1082816 [Mycena haematopus]|nr:hypothetical protein B0H12DRAFT_1082816 [Mycena haematopus]
MSAVQVLKASSLGWSLRSASPPLFQEWLGQQLELDDCAFKSVQQPLTLFALHHSLNTALALKSHHSSYLLMLCFSDAGYWADMRSVMEHGLQVEAALVDAKRQEAELCILRVHPWEARPGPMPTEMMRASIYVAL